MRKLIKLAERFAMSNAPVLLTGESGTGKELVAELIHTASQRSDKQFVSVNCAALSPSLMESELFGHERGAFTDAHTQRIGRFEQAAGGTLMLDEVSEIPIHSQAKLLRVLETNRFERVGSSRTVQYDVRIISASNKDLLSEIDQGNFRLDLYHRLNVVRLKIPPLRQRPEDLPVLAMHFLRQYAAENPLKLTGFSKDALQTMADYHWPGNVRELKNVIHRACILAEQTLITRDHLDIDVWSSQSPCSASNLPESWLQTELAEIEKQVITAALNKYGNQRVVAEKLGVSPRTLSNKIRLYREDNTERRSA